jgi:hypothetical protein
MGRETPNTCYDANNTIVAPILQCVSAAPPTLVHHRFERYCGRACLAEAVSPAENQHQQGWQSTWCAAPQREHPVN